MKVPASLRKMSKLTEANKFFFGQEKTKDVRKLFENSDDNGFIGYIENDDPYENLCFELQEKSVLNNFMHSGYYENWVSGPSIQSSSDSEYRCGLGFGWLSKLTKSGTKADRMKFHLYTNDPSLVEKITRSKYSTYETILQRFGLEIPMFSSNDFSLVQDVFEYYDLEKPVILTAVLKECISFASKNYMKEPWLSRMIEYCYDEGFPGWPLEEIVKYSKYAKKYESDDRYEEKLSEFVYNYICHVIDDQVSNKLEDTELDDEFDLFEYLNEVTSNKDKNNVSVYKELGKLFDSFYAKASSGNLPQTAKKFLKQEVGLGHKSLLKGWT